MKAIINYASVLNEVFWKTILNTTEVRPDSLPALRIFISLFWLLFCFPNFTWISEFPDRLFFPPIFSIGFFFEGFPSSESLLVLNLLILIANVCLILGIKSRYAGLLFVVLNLICYTFHFSFNKIDHNTNIPLVLVFLMSFTNWGTRLALVPDTPTEEDNGNKCLALSALVLSLAFLTAGVPKLAWLNTDFSRNGMGSWFYPRYFREAQQYMLTDFTFYKFPFWAFKIMDYIALIFEMLFLVWLMKSRKMWKTWIIIACFFHMTNVILLNIGGFISMAIVYVSFFDFSPVFDFLNKKFQSKMILSVCLTALTSVVIVRVIQLTKGIPAKIIFFPDYARGLYLYAEVVLWAITIIFSIYLFRQSIYRR